MVDPSGDVRVFQLHEEPDHLAAFRRELDCRYVDVVALDGQALDMWVDDEGLIVTDPAVNIWATAVARAYGFTAQPYAGRALFCATNDEGDSVDLPHDALVRLLGGLGLIGLDVVALMIAAGVQVVE